MSTYPDLDSVSYPFILTPNFNTLVTNFNGGGEKRRQKLLYPIYNIQVNYKYLTVIDAKTLYEFYMARSGMYESFYIFDYAEKLLHTFIHKDQYCGTGNDDTTIFDIPGKSTSSQTIYVAGVDTTSTSTVLVGGGSSDSDRIEFNTAPATGSIITIDFAGYLRMKVRFADDKLARVSAISNFYSYNVELKGLSE